MSYTPPNVPNWTTIVKSTDEDVASSTVEQDDDELFFPVAANSVYAFEMEIHYTNAAGSAPDFKMHIQGPTASVGGFHALGLTTTDGANHTVGGVSSAPAGITFGAGILKRIIFITHGLVTIDSTSGNVRLRWCQNSSNATPTRVEAGSILRWRLVTAA